MELTRRYKSPTNTDEGKKKSKITESSWKAERGDRTEHQRKADLAEKKSSSYCWSTRWTDNSYTRVIPK